MNDDDFEEFYAITPEFCEEYGLYYNKTAADEAAMSEEDFIEEIKKMDVSNEEGVEKAMINLLKERYITALKGVVN